MWNRTKIFSCQIIFGTMPKVKSTKRVLSSPYARLKTSTKLASVENNSKVTSLVTALKLRYEAASDPVYAEWISKYMRNQFQFYGIKAPVRRAIDKEVLETVRSFNSDEIQQLLLTMWKEENRTLQSCAVDLAEKHCKILCGNDLVTCQKALQCVKFMITEKSWWDTVDLLAYKVVGYMVGLHPGEMKPIMDDWIKDDNLWLRRTAILHQLNFKEKTDKETLFRYCLLQASDPDFFIRKAIGWALRTYFQVDPKSVKTFVKVNKDKLSKLSVKEALKHA